MKCAVYGRYSTEQQSGASIADQHRVCERIAERHGFTVVARFSDAAISGGTSARVGYQSLLAAARRNEFDAIVAEDTSRLWRNMAEQAPRLAELADLGIHVVTHDLDTRSESAGMLGAVLGASSEAYRKEIGRPCRSQCRSKRPIHSMSASIACRSRRMDCPSSMTTYNKLSCYQGTEAGLIDDASALVNHPNEAAQKKLSNEARA
jgi:hypothetical protein